MQAVAPCIWQFTVDTERRFMQIETALSNKLNSVDMLEQAPFSTVFFKIQNELD